MRKLFFAILAVLLMAGQCFAVTQTLPYTGDILGGKGYQSDPHRIFRMVRYVPPSWADSTTLVAESIVVWETSGDDGVTVTTSTVTSDSRVAGVIATQALTPETDGNTAAQDAGKRNWTWLQTYGLAQTFCVASVGAIPAGGAFGTSTTAGEAAGYISNTTSTLTQGKAGFVMDACTAGDNDVEVFIIGVD